METRISAVICTYNRSKYLSKAILSLVGQSMSESAYEIIVVDNGSTDNTRYVVLEVFKGIHNLYYLNEPILGLSQARNTGWRNAKGEYIAYLDDDAIAYPQWLEKILDVFETVRPKPGCVGGKIEPIWEAPRPQWLSDKVIPYLTIIDWSRKPVILKKKEWIAGANMAFPRNLLESVGGFQVNLGREGRNLLSMEEILLRQKIEKSGFYCFYHPEIAVRHHILASRLTKAWFIRRSFWQGISEAIASSHFEYISALKRLLKAASSTISLLLSPIKVIYIFLPTNNPDRFTSKLSSFSKMGYAIALLDIKILKILLAKRK